MTPSASIASRTTSRTTSRTAAALASLALVLALAGCASAGTTYGNTTGAPGTGVYVIQNTAATSTSSASASVLEFSTSASGTATPIATIANPGVTSFAFLAVDATGNVYTAATTTTTATPSTSATSIVEYPMGSQNNAQPTRSIPFNTTTGVGGINGLAVDAAGDIFAAGFGSGISVFTSTATGSVAPSRSIPIGTQAVDLTTLEAPYSEAVDASGNLYVANQASPDVSAPAPTAPILVFAPAATGSVAPTRTLSGALTTLAIGSPAGIATDPAGNLYVANNAAAGSSILVFAPTATGNTPPLRDITGSNTQLGCLGGIALDTEGYLYVVSTTTCTTSHTASPTVLKFSTTGDGNIAPAATFTSTTWTNADPTLSIAVY